MDRSCKLESVVLEGTWLLIALSEYVHPIFSRICFYDVTDLNALHWM